MTGVWHNGERKRKSGVQPRTEKFSKKRKKRRKKPHGSSRIRYGPTSSVILIL